MIRIPVRVKKWVEETNNYSIVYDYDVDGLCSATLMTLISKRLNKKINYTNYSKKVKTDNNSVFTDLENEKNIIILDLGLTKKELEKQRNKKILLIDHHKSSANKSFNNVTVWKKIEPYTPTTKMVYDLGTTLIKNFEQHDWIAAIGIIADYGGPTHQKFVKNVHKKHGLNSGENPFFNSDLGLIGEMLNSLRIAKKDMNIGIKALIKSETPQTFLKGENYETRKIHNTHQEVKIEVENELQRFKTKKIVKGKRIMYKMDETKYNLRSTISTIISSRNPDKTVAILQENKNGTIGISMRTQKENLLKIVEEIKKHVTQAIGGGHEKAAALTIPTEDVNIFQQLYLKTK